MKNQEKYINFEINKIIMGKYLAPALAFLIGTSSINEAQTLEYLVKQERSETAQKHSPRVDYNDLRRIEIIENLPGNYTLVEITDKEDIDKLLTNVRSNTYRAPSNEGHWSIPAYKLNLVDNQGNYIVFTPLDDLSALHKSGEPNKHFPITEGGKEVLKRYYEILAKK